MRTRHVKSACLSTVKYVPLAPELKASAPGRGLLIVRFRTGGKFCYLVPRYVPGLLMAARSRGKAFHQLVKRHGYQAVKLEN